MLRIKKENPLNILVIDNDIIVLTVLRDCINATGHTVEVSQSIDDAITKVKSSKYDLIIADVFFSSSITIKSFYRKAKEFISESSLYLITTEDDIPNDIKDEVNYKANLSKTNYSKRLYDIINIEEKERIPR